MRAFIILILVSLCLNFTGTSLQAQAISKLVTVNYSAKTIEDILQDLSSKYGVKFSYSSNYVPLKKKVSVNVKEQPLSVVLKKIFAGTGVSYEEMGNQIVLRKSPVQDSKKVSSESKKNSSKENVITERNEIEIKDSILETATVSIEEEPVFFEEPKIIQSPQQDTLSKQELKKVYRDEKRKLKKQYYAKLDSIDKSADKSSKGKLQRDFKRVVRNLELELNTVGDSLNILNHKRSDSIQRESDIKADSNGYYHQTAQATFVPPIGTNGSLATQTVNNLSLNFAGQAAALEGFEVGLLLNSEKDYVRGIQIAGLGNLVGNNVNGFQAAPLFNINGKYTQGVQCSGFMNWVNDSSMTFQAAGFMNYVGGPQKGTQFAGFTNITKGSVHGAQAAGFSNFVLGEVHGTQIAGFLNTAISDVKGAQIAGFMNVAPDTITGVQISGFMNYGKTVKGSQISFINFADSVSGVQIGFLSFCRKGYRRVEIFGGEALHANIAFKTGTNKFYNILAAGTRIDLDDLTWAGGYGIGTLVNFNKTLNLSFDLLCYYVHTNSQNWEELNLLNQVKATFGINLTKKTSIFFGPSFNVAVSDHYNKESANFGMPFVPDWKFYTKNYSDGWNVSMWIGGNIGMRF